jgi:Ca2+-binding RTX toxin-like protein
VQVLSVYENSSDHDHIFVLSSTAPFDYPSNQSEIDAFYASIDPENPAEIIQDGPFAPGLNFTPSDAASVISSTDNDVWAGSDFSDFWSSGAGNDTLAGGAGDDIMKGGIGSDTYLFEPGDEADVIEESGGESDRVEILITEDIITPDYDISVWRGAQPGSTWEGTLYIQYGQNDILELKNQFDSHGAHLVETISFEFQQESGPSQISEYAMYTGTTGGESADLLVARTVVDYLKGNGGVDALIAGANNDVLFGHSGDDYLLGGTGNDTLRGGVRIPG